MRRSCFLKYISIIAMLSSLIRFFFGGMMVNFFTTSSTFGAVGNENVSLALTAFFIIACGAVAELVCGFVGAINWEEPLAAEKCVRWGITASVLGLAGNVVQTFTGYHVSFVTGITGTIIPVLYLWAAARFLKKRAVAMGTDPAATKRAVTTGTVPAATQKEFFHG